MLSQISSWTLNAKNTIHGNTRNTRNNNPEHRKQIRSEGSRRKEEGWRSGLKFFQGDRFILILFVPFKTFMPTEVTIRQHMLAGRISSAVLPTPSGKNLLGHIDFNCLKLFLPNLR